MTHREARYGRRLLAAVYNHIQNQPALKRWAVRIMMRFPRLGARAMAAVVPASADAPYEPGPADMRAQMLYLRAGYHLLLADRGPADRGPADRGPAAPPPGATPSRQLLVDISGLVERDARTGIQRVVRNLTRAMAAMPPPGWRVEPVYVADGQFHYARRFCTRAWRLPELGLPDEPVSVGGQDVFFTADLAMLPIADMREPLLALREQGVPLHFVLYDLIPIFHPEFYQGEIDPRFSRWLRIMLELADHVWCISGAVADELSGWLQRNPEWAPGQRRPQIGWFHLGADIARHRARVDDAARALALAEATPATTTFLMVGTIEPRKGHGQALAACEQLWAAGRDVNLIIIGKEGWSVKPLAARLRRHAQSGKRLLWLENANDAVLAEAYAGADALLFASYAEGFGLPLIEAAQHGLPIVARDLPVFREVAGDHAWYFHADAPAQLADALQQWIALHARGEAPASRGMPHLSWEQSACRLLARILPEEAGRIV